MKLIYMEITHNTDDSARDLSSLDEGEELRGRKKERDSDFFFFPSAGHCCRILSASLPPSSGSGHVCLGCGYSHLCVCVCVCVCVMESVCVNSCPCADPVEL